MTLEQFKLLASEYESLEPSKRDEWMESHPEVTEYINNTMKAFDKIAEPLRVWGQEVVEHMSKWYEENQEAILRLGDIYARVEGEHEDEWADTDSNYGYCDVCLLDTYECMCEEPSL